MKRSAEDQINNNKSKMQKEEAVDFDDEDDEEDEIEVVPYDTAFEHKLYASPLN